jgi:GT2 family glycosyltransferase
VNLAANRARAPYLLLLNPDTIIESPLLDEMEAWLRADPRTSVVGPRVRNQDGSTQPSARRFPGLSTVLGGRSTWLTRHRPNNWWSRRNLLGLDSRNALNVDWVAGSCLMTRRDVFERVGGLDESFFLYWEDADYCRRVVKAGGRCTYLPNVSVRHLGGGSARYVLPEAIRAFHRGAFRLYWKHAGVIGRLTAPLVGAGLYLRGELRLRRAVREAAVPAQARAAHLTIDHVPHTGRVHADAEQQPAQVA